MKNKFLRWLLSAAVVVGNVGFGAADYSYAFEYEAIINNGQEILTDDESIACYANQEFLNHKESIVVKVYEEQYEPIDVANLIVMTDAYHDINDVKFSYFMDGNVINLVIECTYITTDEQNAAFEEALDEVMDELNLDEKTDYEKVRVIHDYIADNVDYDYEHLKSEEQYLLMYSAYAALFDGKAVCQGYASLFYRMCNEAGVTSKIISGYGNGERHAWNIVKIGDDYFNIDTTWDGQNEETYHDFFLKNEEDFVAHLRDPKYDTNEFNENYPMALSSWIDFNKFLIVESFNQDNIGTVTFNTVDGTKVTNQAVNKPKVIIYGDTNTCTNASLTAKSLANGDLNDVDILFVDCFGNDFEVVKAFEEKYVAGAFPVAYGTETDDKIAIDSSFWNYVHNTLGVYDGVVPPFVVYIDSQNKVQYAEITGFFSEDHVRDIIYTYIEGNEIIELSEKKLTLLTGDKKELDVLCYGTQKNSQFFKWTSSDESVVAVDEYGNLSAVSKGTATITCKVNNSISLKCNITVNEPLREIPDGLNKDADGVWRYYTDGAVNISFTGLAKNKYGWWHVTKGVLDITYTGMSRNQYGWWYVKNGKLDLTYTGLSKNQYGWWYIKNGRLDTTYTGMAKNKYGWWYMKNGELDLTYTGLSKNQYGWWYMKNGKLDTTYTGMAKNKYGWWYVKDGKLDLTYTGMAKNKYGWWHMKNGKLDLTYTGISINQYGWWYVKDGKLDMTYTGMATYNGQTYNVKNGRVIK